MLFIGILLKEGFTEMKKEAYIPYIESDILLDGELKENIWNKACILNDFYIAGLGKKDTPQLATQQTEVKVFYNSQNLYLGIICFEDKMDKINKGLPQEEGYTDIPLEWTGDIIEIFLKVEETIYHLAFNPNGAKWDSSEKEGLSWSEDWFVKTSLKENMWVSEVIIPFSSLTQKGKFSGTPNSGQVWEVNICRAEKPHTEFSSWNFTPTNFLNRSSLGKFIFKREELVPVFEISPGSFFSGENKFSVIIKNPYEKEFVLKSILKISCLEASYKFEKEIDKREIIVPSLKTINLEIPYKIENEGEYKITFIVNSPEYQSCVFNGSVKFSIYPLNSKINEMIEFINNAEVIKKLDISSKNEVKKFLESLNITKSKIENLKRLVNLEGVDQGKISISQKIEEEIKNLQLMYYNKINPLRYAKNKKFVIAVDNPGNKIFRDEPYYGKNFTNIVRFSLCRNEYETRQIIIFPLEELNEKIYFEVNNLENENKDIIPSLNIEIHKVVYVKIKKSPSGTKGGFWPDILYPVNSIELKNEIQPVFLTIHVGKKQREGIYKGNINIKNEKGELLESITCVVKVYPFEIPEPTDFKTDFWFDEWHIQCRYGKVMTPEFYRKCMELLKKYHLVSYPTFRTIGRELIIYLEENGDLTFDFSKIDQYLEAAVENGLTMINISFTNNYFQIRDYFKVINVIERKTGKRFKLVVNNPNELTKKFLKDIYNHIIEKKWFTPDKIYCDILDEPWSREAKEKLIEASKIVHSAIPSIKTYAAGAYPKMGVDGYIDVWCPQIRQFKEDDYEKGEELWWYQCLYKVPYPTFSINRPGIELRTLFWICWKYNVSGFLYWTSIGWETSDMVSKGVINENNKWADENFLVVFDGTDFPGDGVFFYPTSEGLIPSIRAVNIREGIDDWEYLNILSKYYKACKEKNINIPENIEKEIKILLNVPEEIVISPRKYTYSIELIENTREKIADMIVYLQKILK